ncbi:DUF202 domain-containing protein [Sphingobacterium hungaricum]|nr:DUF202 domain-containing protein [Sphingobacterium hungaricum]
MGKELILREKLAIERTHMANQTTFLSYLRTAMYFFVAGLTIDSFFPIYSSHLLLILFFCISIFLLLFGGYSFYKNRKWINRNKIHIGEYKSEFEDSNR